ncbi:Putative E3 ubiquitin-protein ligase SH3RF2 [Chelonia mydas]|uniref:Putative E3 ubiquitin-protein ligase SH3RF2 n=1 Tax=Chelonia mydas TaxID=8469 RepID=M7BYH8_CHEMY|nr:Putative E3 ubiquitin-protein ligase SH3RF2 [Chelonia mydas]
MDDFAILDLLECPVCFEKLDVTAKVLPCQHTFCKPCLQGILKSQNELRCPECRTLVFCSIDELPSNLLLIRLLDGVRYGQNVTRFGSVQRSRVLTSPASIRRDRGDPRGLQLNQYRLAPNPRIHMEGLKLPVCAPASSPFQPLQFLRSLLREFGENCVALESSNSSVLPRGLEVSRRGDTEAKASPVSRLIISSTRVWCVALHSYTAHGPEELDLQKGEGVRVFGKYHEGWLRGMSLVTGRVGIFPSNYVVPLFRKSPNFSESRMPSLYATWTLSTGSLSSQGSISENGPRQSRPLKSAFMPTVLSSPLRNVAVPATSGQTSLRRGRGSTRKNGSLQRPVQSGALPQVVGSLSRAPVATVRPQQLQLYQHVSSQPPVTPGMADPGARPSASHDASLLLVPRAGESRSPSVCSSMILDAKESPAKSEPAPKPPPSAPPSILVKPDTSRNSTEKIPKRPVVQFPPVRMTVVMVDVPTP